MKVRQERDNRPFINDFISSADLPVNEPFDFSVHGKIPRRRETRLTSEFLAAVGLHIWPTARPGVF
jgi:hypothetical protein